MGIGKRQQEVWAMLGKMTPVENEMAHEVVDKELLVA